MVVNLRIIRVDQSSLLEDVLALVSIIWLLAKQDQMPEVEIQCDRKMTSNF